MGYKKLTLDCEGGFPKENKNRGGDVQQVSEWGGTSVRGGGGEFVRGSQEHGESQLIKGVGLSN